MSFAALTGALAGMGGTGEAAAEVASKVKEAAADGSWNEAYKAWKVTESVRSVWRDRNIPEIPDDIDDHIPEICRRVDRFRQIGTTARNTAIHHATKAAVASGLVSEAASAAGAAGSGASSPAAAAGRGMLSGIRGSLGFGTKHNAQSCPHCGKPSPAAAAAALPAAAAAALPAAAAARTLTYNRNGRLRNERGRFTSAPAGDLAVQRMDEFLAGPNSAAAAAAIPEHLTVNSSGRLRNRSGRFASLRARLLKTISRKTTPNPRRFTRRYRN